MPKSRGRKPSGRRPRRPHGPPTGPGPVLMRMLATERDPLVAEVMASEVLGRAYASQVVDKPAIVDALSGQLLRQAVGAARPGAHELVAVLASIAPPAVAEAAQQELDRRSGGVADPPLVAALRRPVRCTEAWVLPETYEDHRQYTAVFEREDTPGSHALVWLVNDNQGGYAQAVDVAGDATAFLGQLRVMAAGDEDVRLESIDPADLHAAVRRAMDVEAMMLGPAEDAEEYAHVRALAYGRLRSLPPANPSAPPAEVTQDEREAILDRFVTSAGVEELIDGSVLVEGDEPPSPESVRLLGSLFLDYACDYLGGPLRVSPQKLELFLLAHVPAKTLLGPDDVMWLPEVLHRWVSWVADERGLRDELVDEMHEAVDELQVEFFRLMGTGEGRGFASQLVARFLDEGVDLTDQAALTAAVEQYNASLPSVQRD